MKLPQLLHRLFDFGMIIKGIDGVLELLGGFLLLFISPTQINTLIIFLTQHELSQDPDDRLSNFLLDLTANLPQGKKIFGALYLLFHGGVKVFLVVQLYREKLWAFPVALGLMGTFALYQCYRLFVHFSYGLLTFTILDVIVIGLVWNEYEREKRRVASSS